jgi:uncharacterized damage-inducible protein DinB
MLPKAAGKYLLDGLAATPVVVDRLLAAAPGADYDRRPDPQRFTTREMMAHLADWEPIWLERFTLIRDTENPPLPNRDPDEWAARNGYETADVTEQQARFRVGREKLLALLTALTPEQWERRGTHSAWGPLSMEELAVLVLGHDGYHLRQLAEWLE